MTIVTLRLQLKAKDAEIEQLRTENWQLRQACGYPIPADKETITNPFKCGTCDAKTIEIERLGAEVQTAWNTCEENDEAKRHAQAEIERLRSTVRVLEDNMAALQRICDAKTAEIGRLERLLKLAGYSKVDGEWYSEPQE